MPALKGVLILGGSGQLGRALTRILRGPNGTEPNGDPNGKYAPVVALSRHDCDVRDKNALWMAIEKHRPSILINASAYTAVDKAEDERAAAFSINGEAPGLMADLAREHNLWLIHYSTDYVFDGRKGAPYQETDTPHPQNVYGASKRQGEEAVLARPIVGFVLRTAWLYDRHSRNFLTTVARLAASGAMRIVADQYGTPTSVDALAQATAALIRHPDAPHKSGLYHVTCQGQTSWHGFAEAIVRSLGLEAAVTPIQTSEYPTRALRPSYSVLDTTKLQKTFGITLPSWQEALAAVLQKAQDAAPE